MADAAAPLLTMSTADEIVFRGPFDKETVSYLLVTNQGTRNVLFKVRTTAPNSYSVMPNAFVLNPGESCDIRFVMRRLHDQVQVLNRCNDKFMIQSVFVPHNFTAPSGDSIDFWNSLESSKMGKVKLRVRLLQSESSSDGFAEADVSTGRLIVSEQSPKEENRLKRTMLASRKLQFDDKDVMSELKALQERVRVAENNYSGLLKLSQLRWLAISVVFAFLIGFILGRTC